MPCSSASATSPTQRCSEGQLDTDSDGYLKTQNYVFTKVNGVYACGDVQDRRYRQAIPQRAAAAWLPSKLRNSWKLKGTSRERYRQKCRYLRDLCVGMGLLLDSVSL